MTVNRIKEEFRKRYGAEMEVFVAPGRVNLIGEHTDYNLGFVLPGAIDKAIYLAITPTENDDCRVYSLDFDTEISLRLDGGLPERQWAKYIYGVVREMRKRGAVVKGFNCVFGGDVPLGAGVSSSAALESVFALALNEIYECGFSRADLARIGQVTEHNYLGVKVGIMDEFASLFGKKGEVIKLDCRSLEFEMIPFRPRGYRLVLVDSMVKHSLAATEYNIRREQCEQGVSAVARHIRGIASLRDVTMEMLGQYKDEMSEVVYRRCAYVIDENQRLLDGCEALKKGDYVTFGQKMYGSHEGLSKEYEVSCRELDFIVGIARKHAGVLGARMMGGGFGGCVLTLVADDAYTPYLNDVHERFKAEFNVAPRTIDVVIGDGARRME